MDSSDVLWVVETRPDPNRMIGFDAGIERIVSITPIPSEAGAVRHMHYFAPSNEIWFGTDASTIGRAVLGQE